jgi:hypothetical protein
MFSSVTTHFKTSLKFAQVEPKSFALGSIDIMILCPVHSNVKFSKINAIFSEMTHAKPSTMAQQTLLIRVEKKLTHKLWPQNIPVQLSLV